MPIPIKKINIALKKQNPTQMTASNLQRELRHVGLTCKDTSEENLSNYISEVRQKLDNGHVQTFGIYKNQSDYKSVPTGSELSFFENLSKVSDGNWEPTDSIPGLTHKLSYIQYAKHFEWLLKNRPGFNGTTSYPPVYNGKYDTVNAIKELFVKVGTNASAALVNGLDKASTEALLNNAIAPMDDANVSDYNVTDSRVVFLVSGYDQEAGQADAIGVLTIDWHLKIKDYKEKKTSNKHDTNLEIKARSVLYDSLDDINADYAALQAHFGKVSLINGLFAIPIPKTNVTIFPSLPKANEDTFYKSLPKIATSQYTDVIVLYSPNLQNVGAIDNIHSSTTTTYQQSVTSGFTFSAAQTFSAEAYFEASVEVIKAGAKIGFSFTFTEQWSKTQTQSFSFSVPGGKKAFTYQGYVLSKILRYDAAHNTFTYQKETAQFLSNLLTTSEEPLVDKKSE